MRSPKGGRPPPLSPTVAPEGRGDDPGGTRSGPSPLKTGKLQPSSPTLDDLVPSPVIIRAAALSSPSAAATTTARTPKAGAGKVASPSPEAAGRQFHRPTPASPQLHGGRVVRATTPDPLSPTGYRRTIDVRFPDDDLLDDPDLDEVKRIKLERERPRKERDFWHNYIGPGVDLAVRQVRREEERLSRDIPDPTDPAYRCIVCTLPGGTCEHTPAWVRFAFEAKLTDPVEAELKRLTEEDLPMAAMAALAWDNDLKHNAGEEEDEHQLASRMVSVRTLRWMEPLVFVNDRLNGAPVDLSTPTPRGGHAVFLLDAKLFFFGGLCAAPRGVGGRGGPPGCRVFHPYSSHHSPGSEALDFGLVTNDLFVYSLLDCVWQKAVTHGQAPEPRMGHVAVAVDDRRALVFGGRTGDGRCLNDAYLFYAREYRWERVADCLPLPPPRFGSAAALLDTGEVALFGGRDHEHVMADLWLWDPHRRMWSSPLTVGVPPSARHGHALVPASQGRVLIMGGCGVGPNAENRVDPTTDKKDIQLRQAVYRVGEAYVAEQEEAAAAGTALALGAASMELKELHKAGRVAAAAIAAREADTKASEQELVAMERERRISEYWLSLNAAHASPKLDVVVLSTKYGAYTWSVPSLPPISGSLPSARMNFSAQFVPMVDRVLVWGGCDPTTTRVGVADGAVYVLNLRTMQWTKPAVQDCKEILQPQIRAAQVSIRHTERIVHAAKARAFSHGVPGGRSMELAQAEATLEVHRWRLDRLRDEERRFLPPPCARYGHTCTLYGGRVYQFGGWDGEVALDELVVLDLEQADERDRRLRDEFAVRLERRRAKQEVQEAIELKRAWYMELCRKAAEERREAAERKLMLYEDMRSGVPAKTRGPTPRVKWASAHTIYVEWNPVRQDAMGLPLAAGEVEYVLNLKGGFVNLYEGLEVLVEILVGNEKYERPRLYKDAVVSKYPLAYAKIRRVHGDGTFDIVYKSEGYEEKKVARSRLRPAKEPDWQPVYQGPDTKAAVIDVVPDYIREREPGYEVFCCLGLQTINVDYPKGEASLMGDVALCFTKNPAAVQETGVRRKMRRVIEIDSLILYAWDGKYWGDGIGRYYS